MYRPALAVLSALALVNATTIIPNSPYVLWEGRTQINGDGSVAFDWEGVSLHVNLTGASYVSVNVTTTGMTRLRTYVDNFPASTTYISAAATNYLLVQGLPEGAHHVVIRNVNEPEIQGDGVFTLNAIMTDGSPVSVTPLQRRIEIVGDSITVGYGSMGTYGDDPLSQPCHASMYNSDHGHTYGAMLCANFSANCTTIAMSGKGMYENCCDNGETMPSYYLQTFGHGDYTHDWDFSRFVPDAMIINLGTNDFGHDSGPAWEAAYRSTYLQFLVNATQHYNNKNLPFFLAVGPMTADYNASVQQIISQANSIGLNTHFLDLMVTPLDGCGDHPGFWGHYNMYLKAQPQIAAVMGWN